MLDIEPAHRSGGDRPHIRETAAPTKRKSAEHANEAIGFAEAETKSWVLYRLQWRLIIGSMAKSLVLIQKATD
jgi:hypothetical protein